jgi:hypothetical protein
VDFPLLVVALVLTMFAPLLRSGFPSDSAVNKAWSSARFWRTVYEGLPEKHYAFIPEDSFVTIDDVKMVDEAEAKAVRQEHQRARDEARRREPQKELTNEQRMLRAGLEARSMPNLVTKEQVLENALTRERELATIEDERRSLSIAFLSALAFAVTLATIGFIYRRRWLRVLPEVGPSASTIALGSARPDVVLIAALVVGCCCWLAKWTHAGVIGHLVVFVVVVAAQILMVIRLRARTLAAFGRSATKRSA